MAGEVSPRHPLPKAAPTMGSALNAAGQCGARGGTSSGAFCQTYSPHGLGDCPQNLLRMTLGTSPPNLISASLRETRHSKRNKPPDTFELKPLVRAVEAWTSRGDTPNPSTDKGSIADNRPVAKVGESSGGRVVSACG